VTLVDATRGDVERVAVRLFGRCLRPQEYAGLAGSPEDGLVRLGVSAGMLSIEVVERERFGYSGALVVTVDRGRPVVVTAGYRILDPELRGRCLSGLMLRRQLRAARRLGGRVVLAAADRGPREVGYYLFPRLGFDAPIPDQLAGRLPPGLRRVRRLLDLMRFEAGRQWWRLHGVGLEATFDLRPGSCSWMVFRRYLAERAL